MINDIIKIDKNKCVGCNNCIRVCPVSKANSAAKENGENIIYINPKNCIHCGSCVKACAHGARTFHDDIENLMRDIESGRKISLVIAPAIRTNFPNTYKRVIGYFKAKGVNKVYDTSFGAEITTWAYLKYIEENDFKGLISQPCPAIVNYIQIYEPKLLEKLSPVHSPMGCTAVYMHEYDDIKDDIAYLSPCMAKFDEVNSSGTPSYFKYSVTFKHLEEYFQRNNINLTLYEESEFDSMGYGLGSIYPRPGGLKENVEVHVKNAWIHQCEGPHRVYKYLSAYKNRVEANKELPILCDVLNCESGCNIGTAAIIDNDESIDDVDLIMDKERANLDKQMVGMGKKVHKLFKFFDKNLKLRDFMRSYEDNSQREETITELEIREAMQKMKKSGFSEQHFDCTACGYANCREMAKAIVRGNNNPENCVRFKQKVLEELHNELSKETKELIVAVEDQRSTNTKVFDEISGFTDEIKSELVRTISESRRISNIADEISIVAFNAGIEAARIGSEGNGFNTVADEVRNLATESKAIVNVTDTNNNGLLEMIDNIAKRNDELKEEMTVNNERLINLINKHESAVSNEIDENEE